MIRTEASVAVLNSIAAKSSQTQTGWSLCAPSRFVLLVQPEFLPSSRILEGRWHVGPGSFSLHWSSGSKYQWKRTSKIELRREKNVHIRLAEFISSERLGPSLSRRGRYIARMRSNDSWKRDQKRPGVWSPWIRTCLAVSKGWQSSTYFWKPTCRAFNEVMFALASSLRSQSVTLYIDCRIPLPHRWAVPTRTMFLLVSRASAYKACFLTWNVPEREAVFAVLVPVRHILWWA